ncbi:MAG: LemA family protein [Dehalococcoidia bacterium]
MAIAAIVVVVVVLLLLFLAIGTYNGLISKRNRVRNAWSQIDVQLKRRHDLIPNLVNAVKGYMQHESGVLEQVTQARAAAIAAGSSPDAVGARAGAENALTQSLRSLFAVAEAYPDLKANQNMLALQEELASTENKVGFARQFYNDAVMEYNTARESFPNSLFASALGFRDATSFQIDDPADRAVPQVQF